MSKAIEQERKDVVVAFIATKENIREKALVVSPGKDSKTGEVAYSLPLPKESSEVSAEREMICRNAMLSYEQRNDMDLVFVAHMQKLYLEKDEDYAIYNLILLRGDVALGENEYVKGMHIGFLKNEIKESRATISKANLIQKALDYLVNRSSAEDYVQVAIYCGLPYKGVSSVVEGAVKDLAITDPQRVIEFFENPNVNDVVYVQNLIRDGVIRRESGNYCFNGAIMGSTIAGVVNFINNESNAILVQKMNAIKPYEKISYGANKKEAEKATLKK